jgi:hypothetical protein
VSTRTFPLAVSVIEIGCATPAPISVLGGVRGLRRRSGRRAGGAGSRRAAPPRCGCLAGRHDVQAPAGATPRPSSKSTSPVVEQARAVHEGEPARRVESEAEAACGAGGDLRSSGRGPHCRRVAVSAPVPRQPHARRPRRRRKPARRPHRRPPPRSSIAPVTASTSSSFGRCGAGRRCGRGRPPPSAHRRVAT